MNIKAIVGKRWHHALPILPPVLTLAFTPLSKQISDYFSHNQNPVLTFVFFILPVPAALVLSIIISDILIAGKKVLQFLFVAVETYLSWMAWGSVIVKYNTSWK